MWSTSDVLALAPDEAVARAAACAGRARDVVRPGQRRRRRLGSLPRHVGRALRRGRGSLRPGLALLVPEPQAAVQARRRVAPAVGRGQRADHRAAGRRLVVAGGAGRRGGRGADVEAGDGPPARGRPSPAGAGRPTPAPDRARQRRADERAARVRAGLDELDRWLADQVRRGLASPETTARGAWEAAASRLVDAQAGALANRVRRATELLRCAGPSGHGAVLAELSTLHTLTVAGRRTAALDQDLAMSVRTAVGWTVAREEVLATPPTTDHWHVVARSDTEEHRITVRRTWLLGRRTGRWGLLLDFAAFGQSLVDEPAVGSVLHADLHHFPGRVPIRALVGVEHEPAQDDESGPRRRRSPARWPTPAGPSPASPGWSAGPGSSSPPHAPRQAAGRLGARRQDRRVAPRRHTGSRDAARRVGRAARRRGRRASGRRLRPPRRPRPRPDRGAVLMAVPW